MNYDDVSLSELIRYVRTQLHEAAEARRLQKEPSLFRVSEVTLELNVVLKTSTGKHGALDLKIVSAGGEKKYEQQQVHKVTLKLRAKEPGEPDVDDDLAPAPPDDLDQAES
jgi:NTP-dependent ternary system trypsin peptidase co-occuring protein